MVVEVKTEADAILDIIKNSGEISVDQLSKKTGIQRDILEQILHFLEEEGYIAFDYRLTNTFVKFVDDSVKKEKPKSTSSETDEQDNDFDYEFASFDSESLKKHFSEIELMVHKLIFLELSLDLVQWKSLYLYIKKFLLVLPQATSSLEEHDKVRIKELTNEIESLLEKAKQAIKDQDVINYFTILKKIHLTLTVFYRLFSEKGLSSLNSLLTLILQVTRNYLSINSKKESLFNYVNKVLEGIRKEDAYSVEENYNAIVGLLENENFYEVNQMSDEQKKDFNDALNVLQNQIEDTKSIDKYFEKFLKQKDDLLKKFDINKLDLSSEVLGETKSLEKRSSTADDKTLEQLKAALFNELMEINQKLDTEISKSQNNAATRNPQVKMSVDTKTQSDLSELQNENDEQLSKEQESLKKIQVSLVKIQRLYDEGNLEEALALLSQVKTNLSSISNKYFVLKKVELAKEIYSLESQLIEKYLEENKERINKIFSDIYNRINELDKFIANADRNSFNQLYVKLKELVNSIPDRFSFEKNQLRSLLLKKLIEIYLAELRNNQQIIDKTKTEFLKLRNLFEISEKRQDYVRMMLIYSKMSNLVNSLRDSEFKLALLKDLDLLYIKVLNAVESDRKKEYEKFKRLFELLVRDVEKSIAEKKFDAASEQFHKLVLLMKKSPQGFFEENAKLKEQMTQLYQKMVSEMEKIKNSLLKV